MDIVELENKLYEVIEATTETRNQLNELLQSMQRIKQWIREDELKRLMERGSNWTAPK